MRRFQYPTTCVFGTRVSADYRRRRASPARSSCTLQGSLYEYTSIEDCCSVCFDTSGTSDGRRLQQSHAAHKATPNDLGCGSTEASKPIGTVPKYRTNPTMAAVKRAGCRRLRRIPPCTEANAICIPPDTLPLRTGTWIHLWWTHRHPQALRKRQSSRPSPVVVF